MRTLLIVVGLVVTPVVLLGLALLLWLPSPSPLPSADAAVEALRATPGLSLVAFVFAGIAAVGGVALLVVGWLRGRSARASATGSMPSTATVPASGRR